MIFWLTKGAEIVLVPTFVATDGVVTATGVVITDDATFGVTDC